MVSLEEVEVALVDDETSERVHQDFMGVPGATDVITFEHGEIVIGVEVAVRQAEEFGEPMPRELFRYLVHGLLHLAGHEDEEDADRQRMEQAQEAVIAAFWPEGQDLLGS
jgi:probable rRNA maturation factor